MKNAFRGPVIKWFTSLIRNSKYRWFVILGSLLYLVSPLDISPDVFPVIGWIDDGLLATIVITELTQLAVERRRQKPGQANQKAEAIHPEQVIDVDSVTVA
ncbi:MAG TPA: YkvA family protein [Candidatus Obscuribacterales bacterium]